MVQEKIGEYSLVVPVFFHIVTLIMAALKMAWALLKDILFSIYLQVI